MSNCPLCNLDPAPNSAGPNSPGQATANDQPVFFVARGEVSNGSSPPRSWC
jgi:hypothetical protein